MLVSLHIENVATIKTVDIDFDRGFTVLSGETGAGKSIIIDSVNLLTGDKTNRELIRSGETSASVKALFCALDEEKIKLINESGVNCDGELSVYREISENGRNLIKCNGRAVPTYVLKNIMKHVITIHGQNAAQELMLQENHIRYLDSYCENGELFEAYSRCFSLLESLLSERVSLVVDEKQKNRRMDEISRQIKEIDSAKLKEGEEEELLASRARIKNLEQTAKYVRSVYRNLYHSEKSPSASERIENAIGALTALNDTEKSEIIDGYIKKLNDFRYEIEDITDYAKKLISDIGEDPAAALESVEERLALIKQLKRKYGSDISEIKAYSENLKKELEELKSIDDKLADLNEKIKKARAETLAASKKLSESRRKGAVKLTDNVMKELVYLDLKKVRFEISVTDKNRMTNTGADDVTFLIATNTGDELKPIDKIASGGELSRIMLALKSVFADKDEIDTIIYDEIDTGISGATSERIGKRMKAIGKSCQVIAITHSAQVAAKADNHILIYKTDVDDRTQTFCKTLDDEGRISELARIIGGVEITSSVIDTAKEMLYAKDE